MQEKSRLFTFESPHLRQIKDIFLLKLSFFGIFVCFTCHYFLKICLLNVEYILMFTSFTQYQVCSILLLNIEYNNLISRKHHALEYSSDGIIISCEYFCPSYKIGQCKFNIDLQNTTQKTNDCAMRTSYKTEEGMYSDVLERKAVSAPIAASQLTLIYFH